MVVAENAPGDLLPALMSPSRPSVDKQNLDPQSVIRHRLNLAVVRGPAFAAVPPKTFVRSVIRRFEAGDSAGTSN